MTAEEIRKTLQREFVRTIRKPFMDAVKEYDMVRPGDRVAVCISGGKDSMLLGLLLRDLQHTVDFELKFLAMDPGYAPEGRRHLEENARKLDIPLEIFDTDVLRVAGSHSAEHPCFLCAKMRRGYLYAEAKKRGCKVMMYGCGIGPINRAANRRMAAKTIDASVDRITLRDDNSRALLSEMGVVHPDICVSADPTIILTPAPHEIVNLALEKCGIDPDGSYIGFGLRNWKGLDDALPEIAAAADYAYEKHGLTPVFVPIEFPSDLMPAERVGALLHCPRHAVRIRQPIETTIGILARMKTVVGIRLHSLMFSAGQGVPVVGMSYDIKVDGFLKYIGSRTCLQLSSVRADELCRLIDECVSGALDSEVHRTAEMLRDREQENVKGAAALLRLSGD